MSKPFEGEIFQKYREEIERIKETGKCEHRAVLWSMDGKKGICMLCGATVDKETEKAHYDPGEKWIQKAIKKPGALRKYVLEKFGAEGFDKKGRIKLSILKALSKIPGVIGRRARLALTLRKFTSPKYDPDPLKYRRYKIGVMSEAPPEPTDVWLSDDVVVRLVPEVDNLFEIAVYVPEDVYKRLKDVLKKLKMEFEDRDYMIARRGRVNKATNIFIVRKVTRIE